MQRVLSRSICLVVACAFVVAGTAGSSDQPPDARAVAIKAIKQLGGKIWDDERSVDLSRSKVTDADLAHLSVMTKLESLNLFDTTVGDAGLEHLKGLTKLNFLLLKQTNVTDAGVAKLKRALPNCETISHSPRTRAQPAASLPVGKWNVAFANGVSQTCEIRQDGNTSVVEPRRTSSGKATTVKGGSVVLVFEDDVVERWTPVGNRYVVQFWFPGSQFPTATPLLGIAERTP
jgi:hypothetical protein